jgi:hypothetical protein
MGYKNQNLWFRKLKRFWAEDWQGCFDWIEYQTNRNCAIKTACIVWWDCYEEEEDYDWKHVKNLVDQYTKATEFGYTDEQLEQSLTAVGFPKKIAKQRIKTPKTHQSKK